MKPISRTEYGIGVLLGWLALVPLLRWGGFDTEETALGIFSSQVHYLHLFRGEWLYWLDNLGFGTPMPIGHRLDAHPVFALGMLLSFRVALSALWMAQMALGVWSLLRLAAVTGIRPRLRMVLLALWIASVPAVCWFYENDWVTFVVGWTTLPLLVLCVKSALDAGSGRARAVATATLALVAGLLVLNSHPGYVAPLAVSLVVYTIVAAPYRIGVWASLLGALLLALGMTAERLYYFASEALLFPEALNRYSQPGYQLAEHLRALAAPLTPVDGNMRLPFVGLGLVLATLATLGLIRRATPHVRGCAAAAVAAFGLSLVPPGALVYTASSGSWLYRDPMFFFALLAGGWSLQQAFDSPARFLKFAASLVVALQVVQQVATLQPGLRQYAARTSMGQFRNGQMSLPSLGQALARHTAAYGPRLYLSPQAQVLARGALNPYGVQVVTDLSLQGLSPITAWFKVVSMDRLHPSIGLMHGNIGGQLDVLTNNTLLDVLAIGLVLTTEAEGPVPDGLTVLERIPVTTYRGEHVLHILGNGGAWPLATILSADAPSVSLARRPACPNDRALCMDFTPLAERHIGSVTSVESRNGHIAVRLPALEASRVVFLPTTYRSEWRARAGSTDLPIVPITNAFLGVQAPAGTTSIDLAFQPVWRIRLQWLSAFTTLGLLLFLAGMRWRRP